MASAVSSFIDRIAVVDRHRNGLLACLLLALGACVSPFAGAQASSPAQAMSITSITLERNCFGCATGGTLTLRRDGVATFTVTGSERAGTADRIACGTVRRDDFDALARLAVAQGFFAMAESYDDPEIRDGPWTTLAIVRAGQTKQVFRREDNGPPALKVIEAAVAAVQARIAFQP